MNVTITAYNNILYNAKKANPLDVFYRTNKKFLKKIKQNIMNYYDKERKVVLEYEIVDKVLISSNILIKKIKTIDLF